MLDSENKEIHILTAGEWGWKVVLVRQKDGTVVCQLTTPSQKGFTRTVAEDGTVTDIIQGNYQRIVMGNVVEQTIGSFSHEIGDVAILKAKDYLALAGKSVHFNPPEIKNQDELSIIPDKLAETLPTTPVTPHDIC